jgi:hypothetical protein
VPKVALDGMMAMGASPRRLARRTRAGLGAIACALMVIAAAPAYGQAPPTPDVPEPVEEAVELAVGAAEPVTQAAAPATESVEPVAQAAAQTTERAEPVAGPTASGNNAAAPVTRAAAPATKAGEPVSTVTEPVTRAVEPVTRAAGEVTRATEPVLGATETVGRATEGLVRTGEPVIRTAAPVLDGTGQVLDSLRASGTLSLPSTPLTDMVRGVGRAGVATQPGSGTARGGGGQSDGVAQPGGRVSAGGPDDPSGGLGHRIGEPSIATAGAGTTGVGTPAGMPTAGAPTAGVLPETLPAGPPELARREPSASLGWVGDAAGWAGGALSRAGLETFPYLTTTFPAAPGSTDPSKPGHGHGKAAPEPSAPAPSAPAGAAAAGAQAAGSTAPILGLVALLLLGAPSLSRFFRTVPAFLRPAPFLCALERPG